MENLFRGGNSRMELLLLIVVLVLTTLAWSLSG